MPKYKHHMNTVENKRAYKISFSDGQLLRKFVVLTNHNSCRLVSTEFTDIISSVANASWSRYGSLIRIAGPV